VSSTVTTTEVVRLVEDGAQLVEVLPEADYRREHLPGAVNLPLPQLTREAAARLDPERDVVVYCYDTQCDLSARGAALLEAYGFERVHDYVGSKAEWLALHLPYEGTAPAPQRAGAVARPAATCGPTTTVAQLPEPGPGGVVLVVDLASVVLGAVRPDELPPSDRPVLEVMQPAPSSVRPSIPADELARSMDEGGETFVVVSTLHGVLIGIVERSDLDGLDR
jgi:rhodanese-related sulfurtransferase